MAGYKKPKVNLHREFVYLNSDTVFNSLSALEAGKVDEILQKVSEAREGGVDASIGYGGSKVGGSKKKTANVEEELRRTRTTFSAFDEWHRVLDERGGFGELDEWDEETRNELGVGDTVRFGSTIRISPVQRVLLTYLDFAGQASNPDSPFKQPAAQLAETKKVARQMELWLKGPGGERNVLVNVAPLGQQTPKVVARLDEKFLVKGTSGIEGECTFIGQVETLITRGQEVPAIRVLRDTPPTSKETEVITEALGNFIQPAAALGVDIGADDIAFAFPAVLLHPIAIFR